MLTALGGHVVLRGGRRRRTLPATEFFQGMLMTARGPEELVEEVRFPLARPDTRYAFDEFSVRHGDFALVAVAALADPRGITLAVGGVADRPMARRWPRMTDKQLEAAVNDFAWDLGAQDDPHVSAAFRRQLVRRLGAGVLRKVMA